MTIIQELYSKALQKTTRCIKNPGEQLALWELGDALKIILTEDDCYEGWNQIAIIAQGQVKRITEEADSATFIDEYFWSLK